MKPEYKELLKLLSRALFQKSVSLSKTTNLNEVLNEAKLHSVLPSVLDTLENDELSGIEENNLTAYQESVLISIGFRSLLLFEQKRIIELLNQANIPVVVLKGFASAINYPKPELRVMGDIDLLVHPENRQKTVKLLQKLGFGDDINPAHKGHSVVVKDNISVEVHSEPNGIFLAEDEEITQSINDYLGDCFENTVEVDGVPILCDRHFALVLILHKLEHFLYSELGLRQLCDWAVFVYNKITPELWADLEPKLAEFGLLKFTCGITKTCCLYLGLPVEKAKWCLCAEESICEGIIERILSSGNFGKKDKMYGENIFINVKHKSRVLIFLSHCYGFAKRNNKAFSKHPILAPLFPFFAWYSHNKLVKQGERSKINLLKLFKRSGSSQRFNARLEPFKKEKK